jgi:hypothetical protein
MYYMRCPTKESTVEWAKTLWVKFPMSDTTCCSLWACLDLNLNLPGLSLTCLV